MPGLQAVGVSAGVCPGKVARLNEFLLSLINQQAHLWLMSKQPDNMTACTDLPLSAASDLSLAVAAHEALQSESKRELPAEYAAQHVCSAKNLAHCARRQLPDQRQRQR